MSIHLNPFALATANAAWTEGNYGGVIKGAVHDFFIKNPYNLTIGNCKNLIESPEVYSTKMKAAVVATVAFGALYTFMLYGATIHISGRLLIDLAAETQLSGLTVVGNTIKKIGTDIFVAGSVPIYALFYALPKYAIESLPFITRYLSEKVSFAAKWTFQNVIHPLWVNAIYPALRATAEAMQIMAKRISVAINEAAKIAAEKINWIVQNAIVPLWNKIAAPVIQEIRQVALKIKAVLNVLKERTYRAATWVFNTIIVPTWSKLLPILNDISQIVKKTAIMVLESAFEFTFAVFKAIARVYQNVANLIAYLNKAADLLIKKVSQAALWAFKNIVTPVWKQYVFPVINYLAKNLALAFNELAVVTQRVALFIFNKMLVPLYQGCAYLGSVTTNFVGTYVVKPLSAFANALAQKTVAVSTAIFTYVKTSFDTLIYEVRTAIRQHYNFTNVGPNVELLFQRLRV